MTNDEWQMTNNEWRVTNDEWRMTNDELQMTRALDLASLNIKPLTPLQLKKREKRVLMGFLKFE